MALLTYILLDAAATSVLVGRSGDAIVAVYLGSRQQTLPEFSRVYASHTLVERLTSDEIDREVVQAVDHPEKPFPRLELQFQGTLFQQLVWRELVKIPAGTTTTYTKIAEAIGKPTAVRAVGSAVGANEMLVLVPCHRVLRSDGGIGGYRWGEGLKRGLLKQEGVSI